MLIHQQGSTEARLQAYRAVTTSHEENTKKAQRKLEENIQSMLSETQHTSNTWRLLKAQYLLELAALNTHFSDDTRATPAMLEAADQILSPLPMPELISVREAIAEEIQAIRRAPKTDKTALMTSLNAALESTWELPITPLPKQATEAPNKLSGFLAQFVTITPREDALAPKPTMAYEAMMRASLRLSIKEAQWAVLENNPSIYQLALKQAIHTLKHSVRSSTQEAHALFTQLEQLQGATLTPSKILPEKALKALNHVIATHTPTTKGDGA